MLLCIELISIKKDPVLLQGNTTKKNKHMESLEHISRKKDKGGLELIDLLDRINTLKLQAILNAGDQSSEVGTQQYVIYDAHSQVQELKYEKPKQPNTLNSSKNQKKIHKTINEEKR